MEVPSAYDASDSWYKSIRRAIDFFEPYKRGDLKSAITQCAKHHDLNNEQMKRFLFKDWMGGGQQLLLQNVFRATRVHRSLRFDNVDETALALATFVKNKFKRIESGLPQFEEYQRVYPNHPATSVDYERAVKACRLVFHESSFPAGKEKMNYEKVFKFIKDSPYTGDDRVGVQVADGKILAPTTAARMAKALRAQYLLQRMEIT